MASRRVYRARGLPPTATPPWVALEDGRDIGVPVAWFDWLAAAAPGQRDDMRIVEGGLGIWWEQLADGVSVPGLLGLAEWP